MKPAQESNGEPEATRRQHTRKTGIPDRASDGSSTKAGRRKGNSDGFEQVEPTGILTANSDPGQQVAVLTPPSASANTEALSADSYLISGAVGRGSTAGLADPSDNDDAVSTDNTSNKSGKHHSHGGHSKSAKGLAQASPFTNGAPADNLTGGVVDLTVRDKIKHLGSNQVHLTLYNYYDTSAWDARNYALTGVPAPKIAHFNERFGMNLGGPLTIPKLYDGRDRTFWFVNYQLNRRTDASDLFKTVPGVAGAHRQFLRSGKSIIRSADGPGRAAPAVRVRNSSLAARFHCIEADAFDSGAQPSRFDPELSPSGSHTYFGGYCEFPFLHSISPRLNILGVYNLVQARAKSITSFPSLSGNAATRDQNITLGLTQNWTSRLINETKVNFNRNRNQIFSTNAFTNNVAAQAGFTGISTAPIDYGVPLITFANFAELADPAALLVRNQTLRASDSLSYTLRGHTISAGAEVRRRQLNTYTDPTARGVYSFSGLMTSQLDGSGKSDPATGLDFADFLLGLPESTNVQFGTNSNYGRSWQFISYLQDDWRVKPRFSVNYGVRYELSTPFTEKNNHLANLLMNSGVTQVAVAVPGQPNPFGAPLPESLIRTRYADFAPRVGIAWRPFDHAGPVVRAGYGMFYNGSIYDSLFTEMLNQPPWAKSRRLVTSPAQLLTLQNGFPASPPDAVNNIYGADPNYKVGYAQIWQPVRRATVRVKLCGRVTLHGSKGHAP